MNAQAEVELESWQATGHPVVIDFDPAVLNAIRSEAIEGLNRLSHGGLEIGGILFGRRDGHRIIIISHRPVPCEYALGPTFTLSANDERTLATLIATPGLQPVGWYHSHTRSEITLSAKDIQLFDRYFPEPWQIALVVRPHSFDPSRAGFFFREPDGSVHADSSYREFVLKPFDGTKTPVAVQESRPAPPSPAANLPSTPPARRRWRFAGVLAGAAVLTVVTTFYYANSLHQAAANLDLRVFDTKGHLRIDWDRDAPLIRRAESAIIEINDGGNKRSEALDAAQLHTGSVTYVRSSPDVAVRLRVLSPDQRVVDQSTRFIGPPVEIESAEDTGSADPPVEVRLPSPRPKKPAHLPDVDASPLGELAKPKLLDPPSAGDVVWTGELSAPATLRIRKGHATFGQITGHLPGQPVKLTVAPEPDGQIRLAELPGPQNAWQDVALRVESGAPKTIVLHWELASSN